MLRCRIKVCSLVCVYAMLSFEVTEIPFPTQKIHHRKLNSKHLGGFQSLTMCVWVSLCMFVFHC